MESRLFLLIAVMTLLSSNVYAQKPIIPTQSSAPVKDTVTDSDRVSGKEKLIATTKGRRFSFGLNLGIIQLGLHSRAMTRLGQWRYGEYGFGVNVAMHRYIIDYTTQEDEKRSSVDATYRLGAVFGHSFLFFNRRLNIDHFTFFGPSIRALKSSVKNKRYAIDAQNNYVGTFWEFGVGMSVGYRLSKHWGVNFDGVLPLFVSGRETLIQFWLLSTPYTGLSVSYQY